MTEYLNSTMVWLFDQQYAISPLGLLGAMTVGSWLRGSSERRRGRSRPTPARRPDGGQIQPLRSVAAPLPTSPAPEDDDD